MSKELFIAPVVSEKAYAQSTALNRFAFIVPSNANKHSVARAVSEQYGVEVISVTIVNQSGKTVRTYRNRRFTNGSRNDSKKAYVTIKAGQSIPIFAAIEEAEPKKEKTDKKAEKKADSKKDEKKTAKAKKEKK